MPSPVNVPCTYEPKIKEENDYTVRGRVFDQTKPETFNQVMDIFILSFLAHFSSYLPFNSYGRVKNSVASKNCW